MKKLFISFLLFVSLSNIVSYTQITIDSGSSTKLDNTGYFYIKNSYSSSGVYFYLKDDSYYLDSSSIQVCYTNDYPSYSTIFENWNHKISLSSTNQITKSGDTYYFYYFSGDSSVNYYFIYYTGTFTTFGKLYAEASRKSLYDKINSGLSGGIIALIVIGSLFGLGIIIAIPIIYCCCCRRTIYTGVGYVPPQPTVVVTNPTPVVLPLEPTVQVYPATQMYQAPIIV